MRFIQSKLSAFYTILMITTLFFAIGCNKATDNDPQSSGTSGGSNGSGSGCTSVQCHGTTKSGARCSRMTTNCSGYCWQH